MNVHKPKVGSSPTRLALYIKNIPRSLPGVFFICYDEGMNIALVASETVWKDVGKNLDLLEQHVKKVKELYPATDIILFPEISLAGFIVDESNVDVAQSLDGEAVSRVKSLAAEHNVALICGMVEANPNGKPFNTQFVVSKNGELLAHYRKNHLFTQSAEPAVYTPGDELVTFEFEGWKCGLSTCFDIRFPRLFEAYKQAGVECLFAGFNWVEGRNKPAIMTSLIKARAHENQYFFAAVDRTGNDPNTSYYGTAIIANPYAEDIARHEGVYAYAEIDKADISTLSASLPLQDSYKSEYHF
jgi:predicted amidohydrolase